MKLHCLHATRATEVMDVCSFRAVGRLGEGDYARRDMHEALKTM